MAGAAKCLAGGGIDRQQLARPRENGGVTFRNESLLAHDDVDSGDGKTWSGFRVAQVRDVDCNVIDGWLEGVEYAVPRPPKKPGGWMTDQRQPSLVLSLVLFLVLACGDGTTPVSTQSPGLCPETMVSVCVGVMLWCFGGLVIPLT